MSDKGQNARALVEPLALDSRTLGDNDLSALSLSHNSEQFASNDFEEFANIQAELERMNAEEVMAGEEDRMITRVIDRNVETETIVPDVEMTEINERVQADHIYTTANQNSQNIVFQTKPTLQRVPASAVQMKPNVSQTTQSQSIMIVSPASGQGTSQILKISHPPTASTQQLQSIAQTLITGKPADGSILQLRSTQPTKTIVTTSASGNITISNVQNVKIAQPTLKRATHNAQQGRNVYTKMILTGNQAQPGTQQVLITNSQGESQPAQGIKFLNNSSSGYSVTSPTKTITLAQAQQMGIFSTNKVQHILPSSSQKQGMILNKLLQSSTSQQSKVTIVPTSAAKSPTKILPAPATNTQVKSVTTANQQTFVSSKSSGQPNPQKVIIRQSSLKPGTVLGSGQVIRIPANQNIVTGSNQIQIPGRQVQYVRLVSTAATGTTNVVTVGKSKPAATLQTVVPLNTTNQSLRTVAPKATLTSGSQRLLIPAAAAAAAAIGSQSKNAVAIPASALSQTTLNQLASGQAVLSASHGNIVVLPAQYVQKQATDSTKSKSQPATPSLLGNSQTSPLCVIDGKNSQKGTYSVEANGIRPRKPCNCTKSQCLKLYCDCFANGEFCHMCNCNNCSNNLGNEEERQRAIKSCLERNPNAFRPKIGKGRETGDDTRRHNKGCNCKRSGCLKNYCECYEAKIPCSGNCKCIGCRNIEDPILEKKSLKDLVEAAEVRTTQFNLNKAQLQLSEMAFRPPATNTGSRQPFNFLTDKVVEITCQCLMAQADEAERNMYDDETSQRLIIEEFGRCLKEIIESAHKAEAT
ncbi:protein lin-54 homolog isoform X3 [Linepithema humile]|uniref:protein lin-54 homolog isoform X3 n=1 Tax=Linepithema humile TaxID=83485 RepID=UPI00351DFFDF